MQERDTLEAEISERSARLEAAGVGLNGKLVDQEVLLYFLCLQRFQRQCSRFAHLQPLTLC